MGNNILEAAESYAKRGLSVIPCGKDKKPLIKWETYQAVRPNLNMIGAWWNKFPDANVGIITGKISGVVVVDVDDLELGTKSLNQICAWPEGPVAQSPRGQHLFFSCGSMATVPGNNAGAIPGCDFRGEGGFLVLPPSVSPGGEYLWLPGLSLEDVELPELPPEYLARLSQVTPAGRSPARAGTDRAPFTQGRRDEDIFSLAHALYKNNYNKEYVMRACLAAAAACEPPFPEKEVLIKIKSAEELVNRKGIDVSAEVDRVVDTYEEGTFRLTEVVERVRSRTDVLKGTIGYETLRNSIEQKIKRLRKGGVIESSGSRAGEYRRVNVETQEIDFMRAPTDRLEVNWPFYLEDMAHTYRKNIIVVAGEPDAGKTAFLLNFVEMNMDRHPINYFSSEMGATEFRARLEKFDRPLETWKFNAAERSGDFHDVVKPDEINIIDFLEVNEDFFAVGKFIRQIFDKLNDGIAIIALQKNKGTDTGLGGYRSLEKARLYLAMSKNDDGTSRIKVVKAKNWKKSDRNPNGHYRNYKLVGGCKFVQVSDWMRDW